MNKKDFLYRVGRLEETAKRAVGWHREDVYELLKESLTLLQAAVDGLS